MYQFTTQRKIEFADTDQGGIVHFSRYFIFMETAEHQFLEAAGTSVDLKLDDGRHVGWPRVSAKCDYKSPARFGDVLDIRVSVLRKGTKSVTYRVQFSVDGREIAEGRVTSVCCELTPGKEVKAIPIPDFVAERIEEAPGLADAT